MAPTRVGGDAGGGHGRGRGVWKRQRKPRCSWARRPWGSPWAAAPFLSRRANSSIFALWRPAGALALVSLLCSPVRGDNVKPEATLRARERVLINSSNSWLFPGVLSVLLAFFTEFLALGPPAFPPVRVVSQRLPGSGPHGADPPRGGPVLPAPCPRVRCTAHAQPPTLLARDCWGP